MSKRLERLEADYPDRIRRWRKDKDGYWIDLRKGWRSFSGEHVIHEPTVRDAMAAFYDLRRCNCEECRE